MINIKKKILIMFLLVFAILSTAFAYSVNATQTDAGHSSEDTNGFLYYGEISGTVKNEYGDFDITILKGDLLGQLIIESLKMHSYDDGGYIPLSDLYEFYDVLCCQKGTKLPSINETYLKGSNGDRLNVSFPYLTMNDIGKEIFKGDDKREPFGSEVYTNLTLGFYVGGDINICRPKEAYILAEMVKELEGAIFYYDILTDANGNKVKYEGSLEGAQSFMIGEEEVYIVEKEYVAVLPDGSNVQVEEVIGSDGKVYYKYKEGSYQNQYVKYEGSLEWNDNKFGSGGTYPSFEYNSSNSSSNSGVVEHQVPGGTQIYVTGSKIVVKEGEFYYHATVEGNNSYIQLAWWTTIAGGSGNTVADTAFSQEAAAFEAYILEAAEVTSTDALEYTTETVVDENGEEKTYENAFKINYKPAWIEDDNELKYPTTIVEADKQSFLVGPFSIDYVEAKAQFGGRPEVEFAGITGFEIYTDASEEPLKYGEDWEFVYLDGERIEEEDDAATDGEEKISYPGSNERFHIRLFDVDTATKIRNMKVHFRYMNAAGSWQELHGKYFKATWEQQTKEFTKWVPSEIDEETGEVLDWKEVYDYTQYWLELTSMEEHDSQFLGLGIKAAKWYNTCTLERTMMNEGKIVIQKVIVDDQGNVVEDVDENAYFDIKYSVDGAINSVTDERTRVRAGSSVESKVFYWMGEEAPTYSVEEVLDENSEYEFVDIENKTGTLKAGDVRLVVVKNKRKAPKEGYIDIIKLIEKNELTLNEEALVGKEYTFNVTVDGTFEYNGETIEDGSFIIPPVKVNAALDKESAKPAVIGPFYWYGDAPSFTVMEEPQEGTTLENIIPESGYLVENDGEASHVTVIAKNKVGTESAAIKIIKTLKNSSHLREEQVKDLNFTFKIIVTDIKGNATTETIHLKRPTGQNENGDWMWVGLSSKYVWSYGENPDYEIIEEERTESELVKEESVTSGTLVHEETEDPETVYEIPNPITNVLKTPNTGKIQITKKVEDEELFNRDFKFSVKITGDNYIYKAEDGTTVEAFKSDDGRNGFVINENTIYGSALQLTDTGVEVLAEGEEYDVEKFVLINSGTGSGTWESGEFTWYGNKAPFYEVEENLRGEDIASSVEPSEGFLSAGEPIKVTAWNRSTTPHGGYLHIIKTLQNADKYPEEYVKSLVFKFEIDVENYEIVPVYLFAEKIDNKWVWEYTSNRYSWEDENNPLEYKITEIIDENCPYEFVSATGPEGSTVNGKTISGTIKESKSEEIKITTDNYFINKLPGETPNSSNIIVEKKVVRPSGDEMYNFSVIVKGTFKFDGSTYYNTEHTIEGTIKAGEKVTIGPFEWYGDLGPEYSVIEEVTDAELNVSIINGSGKLTNVKDSEVTIINDPGEPQGGYFMIQKAFEGMGDPKAVYKFKYTVRNVTDGTVVAEGIESIKAGENFKSNKYTWENGEQPYEVTVEEIDIPEGVTCVSERVQTKSLEKDQTIEFKFINKCEPKKGNFSIEKIALIEKIVDPKLLEQGFEIKATITGELFEINGQQYADSYTLPIITLKGGQKFTSLDITWWGENAPTIQVEETNLPLGWVLVGISNNGLPLDENKTLEIEVTNKLPFTPVVELTTKLAGEVWEDEPQDKDGKNTPESVANGIKDAGENPVKGDVEVYIYKVVRDKSGTEVEKTLATVYKDINNTPLSLPIITAGDGTWNAPRVEIPLLDKDLEKQGYTAGYDVEFVYDGQTYEPTKFLATSNGDAAKFVGEKTIEKDKYANDSMALDYDREVVNNRILEVKGKSPIDGNGDTFGTAVGNEKDSLLFYKSNAPENDGNMDKKNISTLQTLNADNSVKELFKAKARTSIGGLYFPVYKDLPNWNGFHLTNSDTKITELGMTQTLYYEAIYNYCLHINLGLVRRPDADVGMAKDLYSAKVTLKGEEITPIDGGTFRFNTLEDLKGDFYSRQVTNQQTIQYTLGLYSSDYYYRAEMYQDNLELYDKIVELSKTIENNEFSEMEVELKYELALYNESGSYIQVIKGINDYFDSSFGAPIKVEMPNGESANYKVTETGIVGSDNVTYNKLEIEDMNLSLASGEVAKIYITFKVQKDTINGVHDTIRLGQKSNVAEISSYSTLTTDGKNAGKVDKDSAPDNLNIRNYNEYSWYEDDTDAAPVLHLELKNENRIINGQVWEDKPEAGSTNGDGKLNEDEALIGGLTTELVEKVEVKSDGKVYDFIWPTRQPLNCLGGKSLKDLTGFDSIIETSTINDEETGKKVGSYEFTRVPSGNYVVRFVYGNDKTLLDDTLGITTEARALHADGSLFSGDEKILTANYDNDGFGLTPAVYNGQDYKTTIYQAGFASVDGDGFVNSKVHDIANAALNAARVSDAMDNEARRLEVIANSETIMNENANILHSANEMYAECSYGEDLRHYYGDIAEDVFHSDYVNHTDLYREYYMFADSGSIELKLENEEEETVIANIDCGLIERPETALVLDKEISSIKITTNDNRVIFNADYDITYEVTDKTPGDLASKVIIGKIGDEYLIANVKLKESSIGIDALQAIDKNENKLASNREGNIGTQNFRFINIDHEILQGTTIEVKYKLTALNVGEKDYTSSTLNNMYQIAKANETKTEQTTEKMELYKLASLLREKTSNVSETPKIGEYLGRNYYTGDSSKDEVVITRIRQVVDYVDNDFVFTQAMNVSAKNSWRNANMTELAGNGYDQERLLDKTVLPGYELLDKHDVSYITPYKNNVILTVDNMNSLSDNDLNHVNEDGNYIENEEERTFVCNLKPYDKTQNPEEYISQSQIELIASKTVSAQDKDLSFDNIAEIVKYQNTVGRRDILTVTGNANPKLGEFKSSLDERDSSATELITLTPPTGIEADVTMKTQILIVTAIASLIAIGGILIIKKKVLQK